MSSSRANPDHNRAQSPTPSQLPPVPGSPTYSVASTANPMLAYNSFTLPPPPPPPPQIRAHAVLSKADLEASQAAYAELMASAKAYRTALATLSTAASAFASALEECARLKEARAEAIGPPRGVHGQGKGHGHGTSMSNSFTARPGGGSGTCTADALLAAAGVHHLIANHQVILSEAVYRAFEVPLLDELDSWRRRIEEEDETYSAAVRNQSKEIRRLEKEGLKMHSKAAAGKGKGKGRDVAQFRSHLVELTTKLDALTSLHGDHARTLLRECQDTSFRIVDAACSIVRAEVDIFESLARKGWTGGGLEDLLEKGSDLFAGDDGLTATANASAVASGIPPPVAAAAASDSRSSSAAGRLFSILPPHSILADATVPGATSGSVVGGAGSMADEDATAGRYQSLSGVAAAMGVRDQSPGRGRDQTDSASVFSFNQPRGARPFSPQPIRRVGTEVAVSVLEEAIGPSSTSAAAAAAAPSTAAAAATTSTTTAAAPSSSSTKQLDRRISEAAEAEYEDDVEELRRDEVTDDDDDSDPWRNEARRRGRNDKAISDEPRHQKDGTPSTSGPSTDDENAWRDAATQREHEQKQQRP